jgi:DNA-binding transcriptional LysR family regulator
MDIRQFRYFVAVAEELHFRRAAERLNISQPPLSQQIKQLENALGVTLFERTNRRVNLTQAGRLFLPEARAAIEQAERAVDVARKGERGELGELRIGFFPSAPLIPEIAKAIRLYRDLQPGVRLILSELTSAEQIAALRAGRSDLGIIRSLVNPILPDALKHRRIVEEPLVVALPPEHPLGRKRGALPLSALAHEPFVFYGEEMGTVLPRLVLDLCTKAGFEPRIAQIANANTTMVGLVAAGLGVAIVPQALGRLAQADVQIRSLAGADATIAVSVMWSGKTPSALAGGFLKLLAR